MISAKVAVTQAKVGLGGWEKKVCLPGRGNNRHRDPPNVIVCGICKTSTNSLWNEVVAGVSLEECVARLGRALNAELRSLGLPRLWLVNWK